MVKKTSSLREPSGKPPGGQAGHKCTTLKRVADPTDTVNHPLPQQCMRCYSALPLEQAEVAARRQIIDVPATVFGVIEHRTLAVTRRYSAAVTNKPSRPMRIDAALEQIVAHAVSHELGHLHPPPA